MSIEHTCHAMNPPFPYECQACVEERIDAALERGAEYLPQAMKPGDLFDLGDGRVVRVSPVRDGVTVCRDHRNRIAVRNAATNRLSYIPEWRLLKARRQRPTAKSLYLDKDGVACVLPAETR